VTPKHPQSSPMALRLLTKAIIAATVCLAATASNAQSAFTQLGCDGQLIEPTTKLGLSKEFILGVFVTLKLPKLYRATVCNSPNVHLQEFGVLTGSGRTHLTQDENGRVTRNYFVWFDAQRAF